jgi:mannose-6-phosphate isomerase-like protein (cupin superfamily)
VGQSVQTRRRRAGSIDEELFTGAPRVAKSIEHQGWRRSNLLQMDGRKPIVRATPTVQMLPVELDARHIGLLTVDLPGQRDEWEMHPDQDELLFLVEGAIDVILRKDLELDVEQTIHFEAGEACLVPQGMWHRQVVLSPCKLLFVTPKTLHEEYSPSGGWEDES